MKGGGGWGRASKLRKTSKRENHGGNSAARHCTMCFQYYACFAELCVDFRAGVPDKPSQLSALSSASFLYVEEDVCVYIYIYIHIYAARVVGECWRAEARNLNLAGEERMRFGHIDRVGQNHIYTVYIRYFWLGNHQIYGVYIRIYTVLANPTYRCEAKEVRSKATP